MTIWKKVEVKIEYTADCKGNQLAVFSEIYYTNGWKAYVDGQEVEIRKVDYLLRGLELKGGKHSIVFEFDLPKYHKANTYSIIALLILLGGIGASVYTDRKSKVKSAE